MLSIYRLPNMLPQESVIKVLRRDLFILLIKVALFALLLLVPLVLFWMMAVIYPNLLNGLVSYPLLLLSASAYFLFIWLFFFFSLIDYYLDVWIITNERIIDVEQRGFFSRVISEQRLYRIQDVTSESNGLFPTIFRYGEVQIQTAGAQQRFLFHQVPQPEQVRDLVIKLAERNKKKHKMS